MRALAFLTLLALCPWPIAAAQQNAPAANASIPTPQAAADVQTRVRELIYLLRYHWVFDRTDEWAGALRELSQIGKPAVPELVAELDRSERNTTLRGLAFALRAIGDRRAVPALFRALDKRVLYSGSDCATAVLDPALMDFMLANDDSHHLAAGPRPPVEPKRTYFDYGRPINEISAALAKLTKHPNPPGKWNRPLARDWLAWWAQHKGEYATEPEPVAWARGDRDLIAQAGVARFGPLFPTGKEINLGPAHEVELQSESYVNAHSYIDLDTGVLYQSREGIRDVEKWAARGQTWQHWTHAAGVDARCVGSLTGIDLHLWQIDNRRWETLPNEIHAGGSLELGPEAGSLQIPGRRPEVRTFLFTTREGGRGVIQVLPRDVEQFGSCKFRYRLWGEKEAQATRNAAPSLPARAEKSAWGPERTIILREPQRGEPFLLNLQTGERLTPPDAVLPQVIPGQYRFWQDKRLQDWCHAHGADLGAFSYPTAPNHNPFLADVSPKSDGPKTLALVGLQMAAHRVLPESFEHMTVAKAQELAARWPGRSPESIMTFREEPPRQTFLIVTNSGLIGILQVKALRADPVAIAFRYRLAKK